MVTRCGPPSRGPSVSLAQRLLDTRQIIGYNRLVSVSDGQEAIDYLKGAAQFHNRFLYPLPSLLLLDLEMPGMDGFAVLEWLLTRSDLEALPVVVLSSSNQEADIKRAKALGADDYVVKPADFDGMRSMAKDLVAHWLA